MSPVATSLLRPDELDLSIEDIEEGAGLGVLLLLLLGLPAELFAKTIERHRHEIAGWFTPLRGVMQRAGRHPLGHLAATSVVATTLVHAFLSPGFPTRAGTVPFALGMLLGFSIIVALKVAVWAWHLRRVEGTGRWEVFPGQLGLAVACVVTSRLARFVPGLVLGISGDYEPDHKLSVEQAGQRALTSMLTMASVALVAWALLIPLHGAVEHPDPATWALVLYTALAIVALGGMEMLVFGLVPISPLDGPVLRAWRPGAWVALWSVGILWFSIIVLNPALSGESEEAKSVAWLVALLLTQSLIAISVWTYFRLRPEPAAEPGGAPAVTPQPDVAAARTQ